MPLLSIKHGLLVLSSESIDYYPSSEDLFNYFYSNSPIAGFTTDSIELSSALTSIRFSRRPVTINYKIETVDAEVSICPLVKGTKLNPEQVNTTLKYGYYLLEDRIYAVLSDEFDLLNDVSSKQSVREKTKQIADLRASAKVDNPEFSLTEALCGESGELLGVEQSGTFQHQLYPYQRQGVEWLLYCYTNGLGTILGDDMGLGKTAQVIALIAECYSKKLVKNVVIVVPNSLLENWRREFQFFCPSITPYTHYGPKRVGLSSLLENYLVVLMPYTVMANDIEMLVDLNIDLLVFDEASLMKNPDSERAVSASRLNSKVNIVMTGTPVENSLMDLWSISNIAWPGYLGDKDSFASRYIDKDITDTLDRDLSALEGVVSQIMIRRMKVDILDDLPEKIDIHQALKMRTREEKSYVNIIDHIRDHSSDGGRVLMEITKLQQYTSHPVLLDEEDRDYSVNELISKSAKFERLIELLDEISLRKEKALVFANHHRMIDLISVAVSSRYKKNAYSIDGRIDTAERHAIIDEFSSVSGFSVLVLHPKTAGMGLNITAANHVIHYSRQWNPALEEQATARAFRNGQTKEVNAYYLYYSDTIEQVIDDRLRMKKELSESVISVVDDKESEMNFYINNI